MEKEERWKKFGEALKIRREELGLTQHEAAAKIGIKNQQWSRYETGNYPCRRSTVLMLARALAWDEETALYLAGFAMLEKSLSLNDPLISEVGKKITALGQLIEKVPKKELKKLNEMFNISEALSDATRELSNLLLSD